MKKEFLSHMWDSEVKHMEEYFQQNKKKLQKKTSKYPKGYLDKLTNISESKKQGTLMRYLIICKLEYKLKFQIYMEFKKQKNCQLNFESSLKISEIQKDM